jgi:hypothetical protein
VLQETVDLGAKNIVLVQTSAAAKATAIHVTIVVGGGGRGDTAAQRGHDGATRIFDEQGLLLLLQLLLFLDPPFAHDLVNDRL